MSRRVLVRVTSTEPLIVQAVGHEPPRPGDVLVTEDGAHVATIATTHGWGAVAVNEDGDPLGLSGLVADAVVDALRVDDPGPRRARRAVQKQDWLSLEQVADKLGLSLVTVKRHRRAGIFASTKVGGVWRVKAVDLDAMLESQRSSEQHRREERQRVAAAQSAQRARAQAARAARKRR